MILPRILAVDRDGNPTSRAVLCRPGRCAAVALLSFALAGGCAPRARYLIQEGREGGFYQIGLCSYYGQELHGLKTASGEPYNMYALTAAHRNLPFGTLVRVTCLESGRSVIVRVNDRGPAPPDRVLDISYAAARIVGIVGRGSSRVRIDVIGPP